VREDKWLGWLGGVVVVISTASGPAFLNLALLLPHLLQ